MKQSIIKVNLDYSYDKDTDSIFFKVKDEYQYSQSIEIGEGIILDFSKDGFPVALEILDIAELLDVEADFFDMIDAVNVNVEINELCVFLSFSINGVSFTSAAENDIDIHEMSVIWVG